MSTEQLMRDEMLPVGSIGRRSNGWWAMLFVILTEGALFAYLLFAYYYLAVQPHQGAWPPGGNPGIHLALPNTLILLASSVAAWWGQSGIDRNRNGQLALGLAAAFVLGAVFVGIQLVEWHNKPFTLASSPYGSLYFTITGFHMAHVAAGLLMLAALFVWSLLGLFDRWRDAPVVVGIVYWHFVDAVWLVVFFTFYVTPLLGLSHG
jgi:heme/copper-type cytochrome/quinol oxidase subunit 3